MNYSVKWLKMLSQIFKGVSLYNSEPSGILLWLSGVIRWCNANQSGVFITV